LELYINTQYPKNHGISDPEFVIHILREIRMKYSLIFAIAAVARAQKSGAGTDAAGKGTYNGIACLKTSEIKPMADLTAQYKPGSANFPCDMGAPIPFGPVPKGCAKLEIIIGSSTFPPFPLHKRKVKLNISLSSTQLAEPANPVPSALWSETLSSPA
jgi:hypothetical protein